MGPTDRTDDEILVWLNALQSRLDQLGPGPAAAVAVRDLVDNARILARRDPRRFGLRLAVALKYLAEHLDHLLDPAGASKACLEAVMILRHLASIDTQHQKALALSLSLLSRRLIAVGDPRSAVEVAKAAERVVEELPPEHKHLSDWAYGRGVLAKALSAAGRRSEALCCVREAVAAYRRLVEDGSVHLEPAFVSVLSEESALLNAAGDRAGALAVLEEAAAILRPHAAEDVARHGGALVAILRDLSVLLVLAHDLDAAHEVSEEAARITQARAAAFESQAASQEPEPRHVRVVLGQHEFSVGVAGDALTAHSTPPGAVPGI